MWWPQSGQRLNTDSRQPAAGSGIARWICNHSFYRSSPTNPAPSSIRCGKLWDNPLESAWRSCPTRRANCSKAQLRYSFQSRRLWFGVPPYASQRYRSGSRKRGAHKPASVAGTPTLIVWGSDRDIRKETPWQNHLHAKLLNEHILAGYRMTSELIELCTGPRSTASSRLYLRIHQHARVRGPGVFWTAIAHFLRDVCGPPGTGVRCYSPSNR